MSNLFVRNNPYKPPTHAEPATLFAGRGRIIDEIQNILRQQDEETVRSIILCGPTQIGKTALLKQLENGRLGPRFLPIYIDLNALTYDSISSFYWDLAHKIRQIVAAKKQITLPEFNQTTFVAAPLQAFFLQLIKPVALTSAEQRLLLLFDNLNRFVYQISQGRMSADLIVDLQNELRQANRTTSIFALTLPKDNLTTFDSLPFAQWVQEIAVGPLSEEATIALMRDPVGYTVVKDVAHYVYELTNGHPANIQQLCHALYEYQQENELNHITVADVATVQKHVIDRPVSETAVTTQRPTFTIQPNPSLVQTIHTVNHQAPWYKQPLFQLLAILLLATLAVISIPLFIRQQTQQPTDNVAHLTTTATPNSSIITTRSSSLVGADHIPNQTTTAHPTDTPLPQTTSTPTPTETPTPTNTPTPTVTSGSLQEVIVREQDGMPMIFIPAGTFLMGSNEGDFLSATDEQPQREVRLNQFYIDKYEVSIEQYVAFLNRLGTYQRACNNVDCTLPRNLAGYTSYVVEQDMGDGTLQYIPMTGFADYPANHISWYGAQTYCQSIGARLPTEAEWEYAARGADGRIYPWGNSAPDETKAVFQSNSFDNMKPVDALPEGVSPFGLFNMAGSLWEWTADWYDEDYYNEAPNNNPQGPETGFARVIRGGAWPYNNQAERIRTANRFSLTPDFISSTVGFRCVRDP